MFKSSSTAYLLCDLGQATSLPRASVFLPAKWSDCVYCYRRFKVRVRERQHNACHGIGVQLLLVLLPGPVSVLLKRTSRGL